MGYSVSLRPAAARQAAGLPPGTRSALAGVLSELAQDPMGTGNPYDTRWSPEFRIVTFGGGFATYIVLESRKAVTVEDIIWAG